MRSHHQPRKATPRHFGVAKQRGGEFAAAQAYLGSRHPLVRLLDELRTALDQLLSVTCVQAAGVVFLTGGHSFGLALAGVAVAAQGALLLRVVALRASRRHLCLVAAVEGRGGLPLRCIQRERDRLLKTSNLRCLAESLERIAAVGTCSASQARDAVCRPRVVRPLAVELRQVASLLRSEDVPLAGVAAVELLLAAPAGPLYGDSVEALREELVRVRYLLSTKP